MALNTTSDVAPVLSTMYDRLLLMRARPYLIHTAFGQKRNLKRNSTDKITFRRYTNLSAATTPLTEGATPAGSNLATTEVAAVAKQYGDFIELTDVIDLTVEDAVVVETVELLGQQFGETIDALTRDALAATMSVTNAASGSNGQTPTDVTEADLDARIKALMGADARMISDVIPAGSGQGTVPIPPSYFAMCDTDLTDDIKALPNFVSTQEYGSNMPAHGS